MVDILRKKNVKYDTWGEIDHFYVFHQTKTVGGVTLFASEIMRRLTTSYHTE